MTTHKGSGRFKVCGGVALALATAACSQAGLINHYHEMRPSLVMGDWQAAAAKMEAGKEDPYGENDRVMYWLNLGTILHYARNPEASNAVLVQAEAAMQEMFTTSISSEASKVAVNETMSAYEGEDFEKVLVYLYTSLNKAWQGQMQDAVVEARRADELLKKMLVAYDKEGEGGTVYKQDAFMLWLIGLYYEMEGSFNDAYIAYKGAHDAYSSDYASTFGAVTPSFLAEDIYRTALLAGLAADGEAWKEKGATGASLEAVQTSGEIVVIHGNGEAPSKRELRFDDQMPDGYVMSIAMPEFVAQTPNIAYAEVTVAGQTVRSELAEPLTSIVLKNFEHRLPAIKARAVARAVVKYLATKGAEAVGGETLGFITNLAGSLTEAADLRSWTLLPAELRVARIWAPEGDHEVEIAYFTASGARLPRTERYNVSVKPGVRTIFSVRSIE